MDRLHWLVLPTLLAPLLAGCPWVEGDMVGECDDGLDNDNDGDIDCDDRGYSLSPLTSYVATITWPTSRSPSPSR